MVMSNLVYRSSWRHAAIFFSFPSGLRYFNLSYKGHLDLIILLHLLEHDRIPLLVETSPTAFPDNPLVFCLSLYVRVQFRNLLINITIDVRL